ncbi:MAG: HAD-IA family hydrolase [Caulobacterales bacterium]
MAPSVILFDLGGVLLPFDQARRVRAIAERTGVDPDAVRALFAGDLPERMDLGQADERDYAKVFTDLAGRDVSAEEARALILSVFESPNAELWALAARLAARARVGGFSDNPRFVETVFPTGAGLDPMFFSAELGLAKSDLAAFYAVQARLGVPPGDVLFIDDAAGNVERALQIGWDGVCFVSNRQLIAELKERGLE